MLVFYALTSHKIYERLTRHLRLDTTVGYAAPGIYNGSKFALEGIGHSLQKQLEPSGIKVTNVEPGPFRTDWAGRSASYLETKIEYYSDTVGTALDWIKGASGNQAGDLRNHHG